MRIFYELIARFLEKEQEEKHTLYLEKYNNNNKTKKNMREKVGLQETPFKFFFFFYRVIIIEYWEKQ